MEKELWVENLISYHFGKDNRYHFVPVDEFMKDWGKVIPYSITYNSNNGLRHDYLFVYVLEKPEHPIYIGRYQYENLPYIEIRLINKVEIENIEISTTIEDLLKNVVFQKPYIVVIEHGYKIKGEYGDWGIEDYFYTVLKSQG